MQIIAAKKFSPSRRFILGALPASFLLSTTALGSLFAQEAAPEEAQPAEPEGQEFSFDLLTEWMRAKAAEPFEPPSTDLPGPFGELDYDGYRHIQFNTEKARWAEEGDQFRVHAFHPGWLYKERVDLFEVIDGVARPFDFGFDDFRYQGPVEGIEDEGAEFPGVVGFRLNYPLNRPGFLDELISFVGASYFRALGRDNFYGLSARGLAINTGLSSSEEFPRFSQFYLERPQPGQRNVVLNAALDSQSVTGAFRFDIRPGEETQIEVTARLFLRADIEQLGIAPMTSMFLYAETNRSDFDDYRPQVHDSNGLAIRREDGDRFWRALNNPPRLGSSYFAETNPRGFGLFQRDRDFAQYQDAEAHYERRPSLLIEPIGDWGAGHVRLVEIPSDQEVNDNIVAFWIPEQPALAGEEREYRYLMRWGALDVDETLDIAHVLETRTGHGGVSGIENAPDLRKFVVDFQGGMLGRVEAGNEDVEPVVTVSGGEIASLVLKKVDDTDIWRLVIDVSVTGDQAIELVGHVRGFGQKLTETWLYQWMGE